MTVLWTPSEDGHVLGPAWAQGLQYSVDVVLVCPRGSSVAVLGGDGGAQWEGQDQPHPTLQLPVSGSLPVPCAPGDAVRGGALDYTLLFTFSFQNWELSKLHFFVSYPVSNISLQ